MHNGRAGGDAGREALPDEAVVCSLLSALDPVQASHSALPRIALGSVAWGVGLFPGSF